ncbi:MAG: hypothetical protein EXS06_00440 [Planctomycetaceae bacterium]|nr:hypothetical protein [Planctomycetaceae bacterium]
MNRGDVRRRLEHYRPLGDWGSGLQGELTLTNDTKATLTDWQLSFNYNRTINDIWNAQIVSRTGSQYVIKGAAWDPRAWRRPTATWSIP